MSENTITIKVNPQDLLITLNHNLTICSNSVFMGLAMLKELQELPEFISGEDSFRMHSPFGNLTIEESKKIFKDWLIKKGFEDLIKGVSGMLIDYYRLLYVNDKVSGINTVEEFANLLLNSEDAGSEKHFPELLNIIKANINGSLEYEDCINSVNAVRNCLVHRNGVVSSKELKKEESLILKWGHFKLSFTDQDGVEKDMQPFSLIKGPFQVHATILKKTKEFKMNEQIEITYQEFNEIKDTCIFFAQDLLSKFQLKKT
jgi:hypothetical protein